MGRELLHFEHEHQLCQKWLLQAKNRFRGVMLSG
jgi:hypothetical protein